MVENDAEFEDSGKSKEIRCAVLKWAAVDDSQDIMKSKRRHELKSNDLAHTLEQLGASFKDWGAYVIGGLAIAFVGVIIFTYMKTAKQTALDDSFIQLQKELVKAPAGIPKSNEELLRSLSRIGDLGDQSTNEEFKVEALMGRADLALDVAISAEAGIDMKFLDESKKAFEQVVRDYQKRPVHYGRALFGLYQVEANAFSVDSDPARKATAEGYLEKLRDDSRLAGVPLQRLAIDRLNELDDIFTKVEFPNRPASSVQTVISPSQPSTTVTIGTPETTEPETTELNTTEDVQDVAVDVIEDVETDSDAKPADDDTNDEAETEAVDDSADAEPAPADDDGMSNDEDEN